MASINQNPQPPALPDFRNLGVMVRILLGVNAMGLAVALVKTPTLGAIGAEFASVSAVVQPALFLCLLALYFGHGPLARLSYGVGVAMVLLLVLALATGAYFAELRILGPEGAGDLERHWIFGLAAAVLLLGYFDLRARALSPALTEARLQALQARIRPHFLFNSINAVLSLIRSDPKRAEAALEDLSELFRTLMADERRLSTLAAEVELARQYLELEKLRLGDRLQVEWHVDNMPGQALVPPLVLQPLLENAVYHGVEPGAEPGLVVINIYKSQGRVHAVLKNPYRPEGNHHAGNKMALANIRERLALHFDAEAQLATRVTGDTYQVHITIPYRTA